MRDFDHSLTMLDSSGIRACCTNGADVVVFQHTTPTASTSSAAVSSSIARWCRIVFDMVVGNWTISR